MGLEIISYIWLAVIIVIGFFIIRASFKLNEKNYPLEEGEKILYEESNIKLLMIGNETEKYIRLRLRITDKRIYVFSRGRYLVVLIYLDPISPENARDEFKGVLHIPRSAFGVEHDMKHSRDVLTAERKNFLGLSIHYTFILSGVQEAAKALGIKV